jgi:hypothetical protein
VKLKYPKANSCVNRFELTQLLFLPPKTRPQQNCLSPLHTVRALPRSHSILTEDTNISPIPSKTSSVCSRPLHAARAFVPLGGANHVSIPSREHRLVAGHGATVTLQPCTYMTATTGILSQQVGQLVVLWESARMEHIPKLPRRLPRN